MFPITASMNDSTPPPVCGSDRPVAPRELDAYFLAGRAIARRELGLPIEMVSLETGGHGPTHVASVAGNPFFIAIAHYAGAIAETWYAGLRGDVVSVDNVYTSQFGPLVLSERQPFEGAYGQRDSGEGSRQRIQAAIGHCARVGSRDRAAALKDAAMEIVRERGLQVVAVAELLLSRGTIAGQEISAIADQVEAGLAT